MSLNTYTNGKDDEKSVEEFRKLVGLPVMPSVDVLHTKNAELPIMCR
jgi:hypothetical protein